jgi:hypothetical protein
MHIIGPESGPYFKVSFIVAINNGPGAIAPDNPIPKPIERSNISSIIYKLGKIR